MSSAQTIERKLLGDYLVESWLGEDVDERTRVGWINADGAKLACPLSVQGSDFDPDDEEHCAPFTVQEVASEVGYVRIYFDEVDRNDEGLQPGDDGTGKFVKQLFTLQEVTAEVVTPSAADLELSEDYLEELEARLVGVRIENPSPPPFLVLRQHAARHAPRRREGADDGTWKTRFLDVRIRRRERRTLAGNQGVTL